MKAFLKSLMVDKHGATAMEYGLILALLFIAMVTALEGFANTNQNIWDTVSTAMTNSVQRGTGG